MSQRTQRKATNNPVQLERKRKMRDSNRRIRYGISAEEYAALLKAQDGRCAICRQAETMIRRGKVADLSVDHDHHTQEIRALLCGACNAGIGNFRENPEYLSAALDYLLRFLNQKAAIARRQLGAA